MAKGLIGKKLGMTQVFVDDDRLVPVTVVEVGPCVVTQIRTKNRDGYSAIQLGFGEIIKKKLNKAQAGHFKSAKVDDGKKHLAEIAIENEGDYELGETLNADSFEAGEKAVVTGISKGKGFQGVVKRWGFSGGPGGHGSHFHRAPGSIGACATPSKVVKGKKMPGRLGNDRVTVKNLEIVRVDSDKNILLIKGCVPGARGGILLIKGIK